MLSSTDSQITLNPNHANHADHAESTPIKNNIEQIIRKKNVANIRKIIKKNIKNDRNQNRKLKSERNSVITD